MSFFNRNRRSFDRSPDVQPNETGYQEKTVFPTDFGGGDPAFAAQNSGYDNAQNGSYGGAQDGYGVPAGGYTQPSASYGTAQNGMYSSSPAGATSAQAQSMGYGAPAAELPMVFASHEHKDIYIYEYSDRVEYYLRTQTKMVLIKTDRKN